MNYLTVIDCLQKEYKIPKNFYAETIKCRGYFNTIKDILIRNNCFPKKLFFDYGFAKFVLIEPTWDFVIKMPFNSCQESFNVINKFEKITNSLDGEIEIYKKAQNLKINDIFAPNYKIYKDYYIQPKVEIVDYGNNDLFNTKTAIRKFRNFWIKQRGKDYYQKCKKFLKENKIDEDLHSLNLGKINDEYRIIDYYEVY